MIETCSFDRTLTLLSEAPEGGQGRFPPRRKVGYNQTGFGRRSVVCSGSSTFELRHWTLLLGDFESYRTSSGCGVLKWLLLGGLLLLLLCVKTLAAEAVFKEYRVVEKTEHTVTISWKTTIPMTGNVRYGTDRSAMDQLVYLIGPETEFLVTLSNIPEGSEVWFRIEGMDTGGESYRTPIYMEETVGNPPLKVVLEGWDELGDSGGVYRIATRVPTKFWFEAGLRKDLLEGENFPARDEEGTGWELQGESKGLFRTEQMEFSRGHKVYLKNFPPMRRIYYHCLFEDTLGRRLVTEVKFIQTKEKNIALGKPVRGTFTRNPDPQFITGPGANERVTDGDMTYTKGMATSGDPMTSENWLVVDLLTPEEIDTVVTYWRRIARPLNFELYGSLDGNDWKAIALRQTSESGSDGGSDSGDPLKIVETDANGMLSRYIKLRIPQGALYYSKRRAMNFVQLFELKVYPVVRMKPEFGY